MAITTLTRFHGDTALLSLVLTHPDTGALYDPSADTLIFSLKRYANLPDSSSLVQKISTVGGITLVNPGAGEITVELVPDDWAPLRPDVTYEFDVQAQNNVSGAPHTVARGQLTVSSDVTRGLTISVPTHTTNPSGGGLGSGTVTSVNITAPAHGITASGGPITGGGSITLALADDLAALEALSGTGLALRTGADTWALATLDAGDGVDINIVGTVITISASVAASKSGVETPAAADEEIVVVFAEAFADEPTYVNLVLEVPTGQPAVGVVCVKDVSETGFTAVLGAALPAIGYKGRWKAEA